MKIGNRNLEKDQRPYVIAEIGVNHEGSMALAKELIDMVAEGGGDAAKFQTYKASKLAAKASPAYWDLSKESTESQFKLFQKYDSFEAEDYAELAKHCRSRNIDFVSTPFDSDAVELLNPLVEVFKIASADITNIPLLRHVAGKGKPVILSTGASKTWEISNAVDVLQSNGALDIALLHCILNYPTSYENAGLSMINTLQRQFPDLLIGYSDHTLPEHDMLTVMTAVAKGATIIEKHFTHDKSLPGNDHYHAMDTSDLKTLMSCIERQLIVSSDIDSESRSKEAMAIKHARRSVVAKVPINKGETIKEDQLTYKRPASGISTLHWDMVIGATALVEIPEDGILQWSEISVDA